MQSSRAKEIPCSMFKFKFLTISHTTPTHAYTLALRIHVCSCWKIPLSIRGARKGKLLNIICISPVRTMVCCIILHTICITE